LSHKISAIRFEPDRHDFHHLLCQLSWESDAAGEGVISVLVCHKDGDGLPGNGFFTLWLRNWAVMFPIGLNAGQMKRSAFTAPLK
jgi:hypothetical protein